MDSAERRIVAFAAGSHGLVHTYELSIPILLTVWIAEFSTTAATLGLVVTVGYGLFGVGALPGGILVDRFGSKPLILGSLAGMAGSFLLASLAPNLLTLALALGAWGVTASVYHPAGLALISRSIDRRGAALGYHGIGGNLGIALGPLATVLLLLAFDWATVMALLTLPAAVVAAYGVTVDVDATTAGSGSAATEKDDETEVDDAPRVTASSVVGDTRTLLAGGFLIVFAFVTFSGLYYRAFLTFLPDLLGEVLDGLVDVRFLDPGSPYAEEFDLARYLYVAVLMVGVFGQYLGGRIADRMRPERALIVVMAALAGLALLFVPASGTAGTFLAVSLLLGVALFTVQPLSQATVAAYSPPDARGLSFGYTYLGIFGVGSLGAALSGTVLTRAGSAELFVVLAGIAAMGSLSALAVVRYATRRD
ncbi:MFS transporter [Halorubrum sp. AD140]|uniref:MFS transporter n=1 Tax=Halorubrum sp. AD140 TaxID=3050073 RepID=UPI002ACCCAA1|nr:MFS transporter [Halorubrum sp. AD140]MDZ5810300.1 MFS transporter [Halorubrum sp. AD140]